MDWEDIAPRPRPAATLGEDLSKLSVADLTARLAALEAERLRVTQELAARHAHEQAAAALFKS